jgi:hypothetical protein
MNNAMNRIRTMRTVIRALTPSLWLALATVPTPGHAQVPNLITYHGRVQSGGEDFNGVGRFKFAIVAGGVTATEPAWSNDELDLSGVPEDSVNLPVSEGLFTAVLGQSMNPLTPSIFTNANLHLRVWFNDGVNGFQQLSPDQRLTTTPYAMLSASVEDGAITTAKIAPGAVTLGNLASEALNGLALTNHLRLGDATTHGSLRVFHNDLGTASVLLDGEPSRITIFSDVGRQWMTSSGTPFGGFLRLYEATDSEVTVELTAYDDRAPAAEEGGGSVTLSNGNGNRRAWLWGADAGGLLELYGGNGLKTRLGASTRQGSAPAGMLELFNQIDANPRVVLTSVNEEVLASEEGGGALYLNAPNGARRSILEALDDGGKLTLFGSQGIPNPRSAILESQGNVGSLTLNGEQNQRNAVLAGGDDSIGGILTLYDDDGLRTLEARGKAGMLRLFQPGASMSLVLTQANNGGLLNTFDENGRVTASVGSAGSGGSALFYQSDGLNAGVEIDGDYLVTMGGRIGVNRPNGTASVALFGVNNLSGGSVSLRKPGGTTAITLAADDVDGNGRITTEVLNLPDDSVYIANGGDASLSGGGLLRLGAGSGANLVLDGNEILARNNGITSPLYLNVGGQVAIGSAAVAAGFDLSVSGAIICEELVVQISGDWPDYVFADDYDLMPLAELEASIKLHKHLPGIPQAGEIERKGVSIGEMQKQMMEKIEELTLYLIDQNKRLKEQESELAALRARLSTAD